MKKNIFATTFLLLIVMSVSGQQKMKILMNDGNIKDGNYKFKKKALTSKQEKLPLDNIKEFMVFNESDTLFYRIIDTKKYVDSKKIIKRFGLLGFSGPRIELYYVSEKVQSGGTVGFSSYGAYDEAYVRKVTDDISYNMGYIYGAGSKGIKKRVRAYFKDCPRLVSQVENNEIKKDDTLKIVKYYEEFCK